MDILNFCMEREARVWTVKEGYRLGDDIQSKVLAFAFGLAAEIERDLIARRTREALARRRAEGVRLGRPPGRATAPAKLKLHGSESLIEAMAREGLSRAEMARRLGVDRGTLARFIKAISAPGSNS